MLGRLLHNQTIISDLRKNLLKIERRTADGCKVELDPGLNGIGRPGAKALSASGALPGSKNEGVQAWRSRAVSRAGNVGNKVKTQTVVKRQRGPKAQLPLNTAESNSQADLKTRLLFWGLLSGSILLFGSGVFWAGQRLEIALTNSPVDWVAIVLLTVGFAVMVLVLRSLVWMSFFGAIMYATKTKAWRSQESLCRTAIKGWRILPGVASTASLVLAQNLLGQSKPQEAINVADDQWQRLGTSGKPDQNAALLYATSGLAYQMLGNARESITWNERAIEGFKGVLEQVEKPKGLITKLVAAQGTRWVGPVRMHLAVVHLHNANAYFSQMNYRPAKENYKRAVDLANQAPESAEKKELLQVARDQLARLKHA